MIRLYDKNSCTQCLSCVQSCPKQCITMEISEAGFKKPQIDYSLCIECKRCVESCHVLTPVNCFPTKKIVYAAWAKDGKIRKQSSSGGCFSVFANYILANDGWVYGATFQSGLKVVHRGIDTLESLDKLRGSKYVQSDLNGVYSEIKDKLKQNLKVLFVGTPCQVAGLYAFLHKKYENLYTCDLVCHGVPSQHSFDLFVKDVLPLDAYLVDDFGFRYCEGWGFELSYQCLNRKVKLPIKDTYYLTAFNRGYMFMEACYSCKYASPNRVADISLGDFWNIGKEISFSYGTQQGISLLKINSPKGERLFSNVENKLFIQERTLEEAIKGNHNLASPSYRPCERNTYCADILSLPKKDLIKKYKMYPSYRDYLRIIKRILQKQIT